MIAVYIEDLTRVFMFKEFIKRVRERDKMLGLPRILIFFATSLINSIIKEHI